MKLVHNLYLALAILFVSIIIFGLALFHYNLSGVSNDSTLKEVVIEPGSIDSIANTLYEKKLIKNKFAFKLYIKITKKNNLKAATYSLSPNMGSRKIIDILMGNSGKNQNQIAITFKEGINIRKFAFQVEEETTNQKEEVYEILENKEYLQSLIDKYWFLENDILNDNIYYSLEGYLYPNTYYFNSKDVDIKIILEKMLDETQEQLEPFKEAITKNKMSIHEIITLASIIELEGITTEDRMGIASVFMNRLNANMSLGSDVTTYYGAKIDMGERDLYASEIKECNHYNTRCANFVELPISPICNPTIDAISAVLNHEQNDNLYFVADKNKKVYFSKTLKEHNQTIAKLKKDNLWYTYE